MYILHIYETQWHDNDGDGVGVRVHQGRNQQTTGSPYGEETGSVRDQQAGSQKGRIRKCPETMEKNSASIRDLLAQLRWDGSQFCLIYLNYLFLKLFLKPRITMLETLSINKLKNYKIGTFHLS